MLDEYDIAEPYDDSLVQERQEGVRPASPVEEAINPAIEALTAGKPSLSERFAAVDAERAEKSRREGTATIGRINSYIGRERSLENQRISIQNAQINLGWTRAKRTAMR